jgi:hypothetical protein
VHAPIQRLARQAARLAAFVAAHDPTRGKRGTALQSHVPANESATMPTAHGVIQGDHGQALVEAP